ncbi:MAG: hypothetical protein JO352_25200 [Chloroflexi bacterium]|nr:hypothetical protein [Chloroflexota bacterium]MBV9595824.1 hypothetical protein [Chloroflexota bacterium]
MAVESQTQRPIEVENVRQEEHHFGGDIVWWTLLLLFSIPVLLWGLSLTPDTIGFLILGVGGIMAGLAFAQIMFRLPYFTNSFVRSVVIVLLLTLVVCGIAFLFNLTLPVPEARLDVTFKPPISGG